MAAVNDVLRVAAIQKWNGIDDIVNVFHLKILALPTPNDAVSILEDIGDFMSEAYSLMESFTSNNVTPETLNVYNVTADDPIGIGDWDGSYTGGTGSGDAMPPQDALLVLLGTGVKRRQGRIYFGGLTEAIQQDGQWFATVRTAAATFVDLLQGAESQAQGGSYKLGVYSRSAGVHSEITSIRPQVLVARMGSRKPGRGS